MDFQLKSKFKPKGDQPTAIKRLVKNLKSEVKDQVLLGVTGSGKTFTLANVIQKIQKPTLIISPNKTLAAQLYQEFKEFFPNNAVHYFVSYYDYYQPEAYIPQSDTYIEKDAKINEEIDKLRHAAVQDVTQRKDVIVVASVSCIYNIGSPENYGGTSLEIYVNQKIKRRDFLFLLTNLQYQRNDIPASPTSQGGEFKPGYFRVRGDMVEIYIVTGEKIIRVEFNGDTIEKISWSKPGIDPKYKTQSTSYKLFPATFWVAPQDKLKIAIENIRLELKGQLIKLKKAGKNLEAERLDQRTNYDLEMLTETGRCQGIENYSSHMEFRKPGSPPFSLVDYFNYFNPDGSLIFIDESHISISQIRAMSIQDKIRKQTLIDFGFRLPSAIDNRPLNFTEFAERQKQTIYVSATPAEFETQKAEKNIVEQLIRPTGLLEPLIEIRKTENQIKDLIEEVKKKIKGKKIHPVKSAEGGVSLKAKQFNGAGRTLVVTLTKRLAEEISDYLIEKGIKTQYLHSEVKTMERPKILKDFREGKFDVLVGINLLREGLDLPEVSLVAILDADKEGFLRNKTTLIQTMGRAARHINGRVILYADKITLSMKSAIDEINRRRKIQEDYNKKNKITPKTIITDIRDWGFSNPSTRSARSGQESVAEEFFVVHDKNLLEKEMKIAAKNLDFERAAEIRDLILRRAQGR